MKKSCFLYILIGILVASCATVRTPIQTTPKPMLSNQEINALENGEDSLAKQNYDVKSIVSLSGTKQVLVSNIYVETDIRSVLMDLSTLAGINIIPDNTVSGAISLSLEKVPLETALAMVLYPNGYKYTYIANGSYYLVGSALPENTSFDALTVTKTVKTNRGADKIMSQISPYYHPFIKSDGQVLTITATPDVLYRIEKDISIIDKPKRQIEVTARFVMVEWKKGKNIGAQWSDINLSGIGLGELIKGGASTFTASLTSGLSTLLSTSGYDTKINMVAEPRIIVEEGEAGMINISEEHMFLILSGGGTAYSYFTTKEVQVGIKMNVQPFVNRDGSLRLNVNPEVSDIVGEREFKNGTSIQKLPIVARRSTSTILKVQNGETVAIGGLINKVSKDDKTGIPFFRKIPIIKYAFGADNKYKNETELVVFITTRIIG